MDKLPKFSVVIVNYNGGSYLQYSVSSLVAQTVQDFELILVDNASTDGSLDCLNVSGLNDVHILRNTNNTGFAAANNQAAELARGKWLVLLNPDAAASPDWLEQLSHAASKYPACKVFTSAQINMHAEHLMDGAGDAYLGFGFPWRGGFGHPVSKLPETGLCFSACGAGAMFERELFQRMSGFDERFFCYCEDVDLGFRLQLEGEPCLFVREALVRHAGSAISGQHSAFSIYHGTRNRAWTYYKNTPFIMLLATLPVHFVLSLYLLLRSLANGRFIQTARGMRDGLLGVPALFASRKWRTSQRNISMRTLASTMSWNPFRMSRRATHVRPILDPKILESRSTKY